MTLTLVLLDAELLIQEFLTPFEWMQWKNVWFPKDLEFADDIVLLLLSEHNFQLWLWCLETYVDRKLLLSFASKYCIMLSVQLLKLHCKAEAEGAHALLRGTLPGAEIRCGITFVHRRSCFVVFCIKILQR